VLIDADMRKPTLHRRMDSGNSVGLSNLFVHHDMPLDEALQKTYVHGVTLLSSGPTPPNPAELLATRKMDEILSRIEGPNTDMVIIDAPPVMPVTDAMVLAPRADGVLIVVRAGLTKASAVTQTVENLRRANANIIGLVINDVARDRIRGYYYRRRQYYYNKQNDAYYGNYGSTNTAAEPAFAKVKVTKPKNQTDEGGSFNFNEG
jgi:capsular exopolysaccharide synthesis family protein